MDDSTQTRLSAFFFMGSFEPTELANFNLQNVFLPSDDGILEVLGHGLGVWWGSKPRDEFAPLFDATRDWLETIAASHFLLSDTALGVQLRHWVEALDVDAKEAVIGFIDSRFRVISAPKPEDAVNEPLQRAVELAGALRGRRHLQPAVKEAWRAALDPSDEALLSAYRALECMRRLYGEGDSDSERKVAWEAMRNDLDAPDDKYDALAEAAKAIRHGDRPSGLGQHPVIAARARRSELLGFATSLVRKKVRSEVGNAVSLPVRNDLAARMA